MDELLSSISTFMQQGQSIKVRELTIKALEKGYNYKQIVNTLVETMGKIGYLFKRNEVFVPEVLIAARAFNIALSILEPLVESGEELYDIKSKVIIGTVQGDLHDIGKNLVKMMIKGFGINVIDLGVDVSAQQFVDAIIKYDADFLAMSSLLTTTMPKLEETIDLLNKQKIRDKVKIIVGGAPVTSNYAKAIGADFYAFDAGSAAEVVKENINL